MLGNAKQLEGHPERRAHTAMERFKVMAGDAAIDEQLPHLARVLELALDLPARGVDGLFAVRSELLERAVGVYPITEDLGVHLQGLGDVISVVPPVGEFVVAEDGTIKHFRVDMKLTFVLE